MTHFSMDLHCNKAYLNALYVVILLSKLPKIKTIGLDCKQSGEAQAHGALHRHLTANARGLLSELSFQGQSLSSFIFCTVYFHILSQTQTS